MMNSMASTSCNDHCFFPQARGSESAASSSSSSTDGSFPSAAAPQSGNAVILQDLFRTRSDVPVNTLADGSRSRRVQVTNQKPRRSTPLIHDTNMSSLSLFQRCQKDCDNGNVFRPSSLFDHLGKNGMNHPSLVVSSNKASSLQSMTSNALFPSFLAFPDLSSGSSCATSSNVKRDSLTLCLDMNLSSSPLSLSTCSTANSAQSPRRRKRVRNQATRMRLVGQVIGTKRVQRIVSLVQEIQHLQSQCTNTATTPTKNLMENMVLVDAWENTPLDDLKSLPWEEMISTAEAHIDALRQQQSH